MTSAGERSPKVWLEDIVEWSAGLEAHVAGMTEDAFVADVKTQDAVIRCIICIGEASRHLMDRKDEFGIDATNSDFFEAYWARNRLAHGYFDIDARRVWLTAKSSVPLLSRQARKLIAEHFGC